MPTVARILKYDPQSNEILSEIAKPIIDKTIATITIAPNMFLLNIFHSDKTKY